MISTKKSHTFKNVMFTLFTEMCTSFSYIVSSPLIKGVGGQRFQNWHLVGGDISFVAKGGYSRKGNKIYSFLGETFKFYILSLKDAQSPKKTKML